MDGTPKRITIVVDQKFAIALAKSARSDCRTSEQKWVWLARAKLVEMGFWTMSAATDAAAQKMMHNAIA